uniref:Guanylate kinase-like domain-containing protein n=1 Tax=Timema genevievae TaxID=629358 RepID=A0A7R9JY86_TIMGE|nr:unnamed protein product [Timema genevievae]
MLHVDNTSAVKLTNIPEFRKSWNQIEVQYYFIRKCYLDSQMASEHIDEQKQLVEIFFLADYDADEILTYEEVSLYYPRANHKRPVVLIGPPNIGRHELRQRLMEDSERFAAAIPRTLKILSDEFGARDLSEIPFVELIDRLTTRFAPRPNETVQYHLFTRRRQQIGESIDAFATDLRRIADGCGFGGEVVMEKMLRNQFVCGLADTQLQQQFFIKPDLTFKIAIEAAKAAEVARKYVEDVRDEATTHGAVYGIGSQPQYKSTFQRIRRQDTNRGSQPQVGNPPSSKVGSGQENRGRRARHFFPGQCLRCAGQHQTRRCTVDQNKLYCTVCDRRGHVESVCLSETRHGRNTARAHQVTDITEPHKQDSEELSIEGLELYNIKDVSKHSVPDTKRQPTMPAIKLSLRIDGMFHTMEVDTGAALTLISEETYKVLWPHQPKLESLDLDLRTWAADTPLRLLGSKLVEVQFKERRATLTLAVATGHGPSLLGRPWLEPLGLTVHGLNVVGNTLANTEQNPTSINSQQELPVLGYRTNNTSRARKDGEVDGHDYHFISRAQFELDILSRKFVEHGEYEKAYYGTSLDAIRSVVNSGKICVLNLHPQSLKILRNSDLKPFVVFVAPPSLEKLQQKKMNGELYKDDELKDIIEKAREMEDKYGHYFDMIMVNNDTDRAFHQLINEINILEREPQWVPATWLKPV